jgi:hypothetical protein
VYSHIQCKVGGIVSHAPDQNLQFGVTRNLAWLKFQEKIIFTIFYIVYIMYIYRMIYRFDPEKLAWDGQECFLASCHDERIRADA